MQPSVTCLACGGDRDRRFQWRGRRIIASLAAALVFGAVVGRYVR